jgi:hypothetical protein
MPSKRPCGKCGKEMYVSKTSHDTPICHPCRRVEAQITTHLVTCPCGVQFTAIRANRKYCTRECSSKHPHNKGQSKYPDSHHRRVRTYREQDAPGLTKHERALLLKQWKQEGRLCELCPLIGKAAARATTIDHVLPLIRGGTNHEHNLIPACKQCNSSKHASLLSDWIKGTRTPLPTEYTQRTTPRKQEQKQKQKRMPKLTPFICVICNEPAIGKTTRARYCSHACVVENNRRLQRDKYRQQAGLPYDKQQPTSVWTLHHQPAL